MATSTHAAHHAAMLRGWQWRDFTNIVLGVWLIASPSALGYREAAMWWSDIAIGTLITVSAALTLSPRFDLLRWVLCAAGLWLLLAPLVFWTRDAAAYANDTLVGALIIAFSVLIPMMPSRAHHEVMMAGGLDTPPGWSYNPSDWIQRGPIIAMAFVAFFASRYLAAFQLGHISRVWDPLFEDGTRRVLESEVSKAWPVSDAGLGAASYMIEALSGFMGGRNRWRTMPWMVLMFGILVVPVGIVSVVLVVLQPIAVGAWCTLCLITAVAMLIMIAPAMDEVVATGQFLTDARREGLPMWRTFWVGGTLTRRHSHSRESHVPGDEVPASRPASRILMALDLNHVPWNLVAAAAIGVWILASPAFAGSGGSAAHSNYLAGALIVTCTVIAFGEIARPFRLLNLPLGLWLIVGTWMLAGGTDFSRVSDTAAGIAVFAFSWRRGRISAKFGRWNRFLF